MQVQVNKIILSGKIIDIKNSPDLQKIDNDLIHGNNSNQGGLVGDDKTQLSNYYSYRFYLSINHANDTNDSFIVPCRIDSNNKNFKKIKKSLVPGKYICIIGKLGQTITNNRNTRGDTTYYNCINVKFYGNWSNKLPQINLLYATGKVGSELFNTSLFRALETNDCSIDIYNENNLDSAKSSDIFLVGYLDISEKGITIFADNIIHVKYFHIFNYNNFKQYIKFRESLNDYIQILQRHSILKSINTSSYSENTIFHYFNEIEQDSGLTYSPEDLLDFHTAMKNNGLVILSGPSGTGKTELVRCYAEALGLLKPNNPSYHYLHIAVSPSWTDDTDLLGYFIPRSKSQGEYYPNATGLVDLLYRASKDHNGLYIVLLDEMNLSRIEYYFSQFLSILELPIDDPKRCIRLFSNDYKNTGSKYPSHIHIYDNVLFVGTINIDESTKNITDKVLDRSNMININSSTFKSDIFKSANTLELNNTLKSIKPITMHSFNNMKNESYRNSLSNGDNTAKIRLQLLNSLNYLLKETTYNKREIGYREVKQISEYLCDLPNENDPEVKKCIHKTTYYKKYSDLAFDYQLSQRILDKLSGNKYELYNFISILDNYMNHYDHQHKTNDIHKVGVEGKSLIKISKELNLDKNLGSVLEKIPHYYSGKIVSHKWTELKYYGFTK